MMSLRDFKVPDFKFPKFKMNNIEKIDDLTEEQVRIIEALVNTLN